MQTQISLPADAAWSEWQPHPRTTSGTPRTRLFVASDQDGVQTGYWECEPGSFASSRDGSTEVWTVLRGTGTLEAEDGTITGFGPGTILRIRDGWRGQWHVTEPVLKAFAIFTSSSAHAGEGLLAVLHEAYASEAVGAALFIGLAELFPDQADTFHRAASLEQSMMGLLVRVAEGAGMTLDTGSAHDADATAAGYLARYERLPLTAVLDELFVWSAEAASRFAGVLPQWTDPTSAARWRLFVAHEAALVEWTALLTDGKAQAADDRLRAVIGEALAR